MIPSLEAARRLQHPLPDDALQPNEGQCSSFYHR
jgi:hypothetical protein